MKLYQLNVYATRPEKTGLIYTKYTYYGAYLLFCVCYPISVSFIEFLRILCIQYDEICVTMLSCRVKDITFERLKFRSNFTCIFTHREAQFYTDE